MLDSKLNWELLGESLDYEKVATLKKTTDYSETFIKLCLTRGIDTQEKLKEFLQPEAPLFHDPVLMYDMEKSVQRILTAIETGEKILIYGDYDADGITSTAILVEAIEIMGGNVSYYLPNRFEDGYGPNVEVFKRFISEENNLIITCDNGVSGHEAVEMAMAQGVDVIITDHHELPTELPKAFSIVHPRHPDGSYPFKDLSGAGVALKLVAVLMERIPYEFMDMAAIGTVADLVSLTDENRWIVKQGIEMLKNTERIGLHLLFEKAGVEISTINEETIGFIIGPRLNALGRLGDAGPGVELLLSFDEEALTKLVEQIQDTNNKRQEIVNKITDSAQQKIAEFETLPDIIVLEDADWHEGVLGIVASRIVEKTGKPTILLHTNPDTGVSKGSGRSIEALHLFEALSASEDTLIKFGGHKMAAGLSILTENLADFIETITTYAASYHQEIIKGNRVRIDEILEIKEVSLSFLQEIDTLRPFGTDNPKPMFGFESVAATQVKQIGADQKHLKLVLQADTDTLDVIGFNKGQAASYLTNNVPISALGELSINTWRDRSKPQLQLKDFKVNGPQFFDGRQSKFNPHSIRHKNSVYLFFNQVFFDKMSEQLPVQSMAVLLESDDDIPPFPASLNNLVLLDCPTNLDILDAFLQTHVFQNYYVYAFPVASIQEQGLPSKDIFGKVYKYLYSRKDMAIREKIDALSAYLKVEKGQLIFMIQVFLEAKFVTIKDGVLNPVLKPEKADLTQTSVYQERIKNLEAEKMFIYSDFSQLSDWLKK